MKIKINSDQELVNAIKDKLKSNGGYCPCTIIHNEDTKCMCKSFREQDFEGECHCGLYIKVNK